MPERSGQKHKLQIINKFSKHFVLSKKFFNKVRTDERVTDRGGLSNVLTRREREIKPKPEHSFYIFFLVYVTQTL